MHLLMPTRRGDNKMAKKDMIGRIALLLLIVGGLNWLLYAFGYNLVHMLFGTIEMLAKAIYVLIGLSALYVLYKEFLSK